MNNDLTKEDCIWVWGIWTLQQYMTYLTLRSFKGALARFRFKKVCIVTSQQSTQKEQDGIAFIRIVSVGWRNEDSKRHVGLVANWIMRYAMVTSLLKVLRQQRQQRCWWFFLMSLGFWNDPSCVGSHLQQLNRSLLFKCGVRSGVRTSEKTKPSPNEKCGPARRQSLHRTLAREMPTSEETKPSPNEKCEETKS